MIYTILLPNLIITLPVMLLTIVLPSVTTPSLFTKVYGLLSLIIILGSFDDLTKAIYIFINKKKIHNIRISGNDFYYK